MKEKNKVVIVGTSPIAEIVYEYLTYDSEYEVVAFTVDGQFIKSPMFFDLPVIPFEKIEETHPPYEYKMFVAVGYKNLNRLRTKFYDSAKEKGYELISYISSKAFIWRNVEIGDNCFIFEDNTLQPFVKISNNVIMWSGNHIGHHSKIGDNCFISSHVVLSGFCELEDNCFLGVNSTISHRVKIGKDCLIGMGAVITKNTKPGKVYVGNPAKDINRKSIDLL